jgi:predicted Rdx family selenoprotein
MTDPAKDVSAAISLEDTQVALRTRTGGYYEPGGKWVLGVIQDTPFRAAVQPTNSRSLQDLPEGVRDEARYLLWAAHFTLRIDDYVVYDTDVFRVIHVWDRIRDGGFMRAALGQVKEGP